MSIHRTPSLVALMGPAVQMGLAFAIVLSSGTRLTAAEETSAAPSPSATAAGNTDTSGLSLQGKKVGITVIGTDHYWDLRAYQGQIDEVKRLGGTPIALDAGRNDSRQVTQIQTLIAQKPDVIIEQLGTLTVLEPWFQKIRAAGIPLFTVDTASARLTLKLA